MNFANAEGALRLNLLTVLKEYGYPDVPVIAAYQTSKQGRVDDGVYYRLIMPDNHGWQGRRYAPDGESANHIEVQQYQTTAQFTALIDDEDETGYNSKDLASVVQMAVQSLPFIEAMRRDNIGVQRPSPIRTLEFTDERDNYALEASFDVIITYKRTLRPLTGVVTGVFPELTRI